MANKIGKVLEYNGISGYIVSEDTKSLFLQTDIVDNDKIEKGTLVSFRNEQIHGENRAYFVKKIENKWKHFQ